MANLLHLGIEAAGYVFLLYIEPGERQLREAEFTQPHDRIVKGGRGLEPEEFVGKGIDHEGAAVGAPHHVARIAQREKNSGCREESLYQREAESMHRELVDDHLVADMNPKAANVFPI